MRLLDNIKPLTWYTCLEAFQFSMYYVVKRALTILLGLAVTAGMVELAWLLFSGGHYPFGLFKFDLKDWLLLGKIALYAAIFFGGIFFLAYFNDPPPRSAEEQQALDDDWYFWNILMHDDHDDDYDDD